MSDKQTLLQAVTRLPETATWSQITEALLDVMARRGLPHDFARLYRAQLSAEQLAEYADPKAEFSLDAVLADLAARRSDGAPA
jgi:hypothetical protein